MEYRHKWRGISRVFGASRVARGAWGGHCVALCTLAPLDDAIGVERLRLAHHHDPFAACYKDPGAPPSAPLTTSMGPSRSTRQRSDKATEPTRQSARNRQPAERRAAADDAAQRDATNRAREQRRKEKRKEQRDEAEQRDLVVEQDDESDKVRRLEGAL